MSDAQHLIKKEVLVLIRCKAFSYRGFRRRRGNKVTTIDVQWMEAWPTICSSNAVPRPSGDPESGKWG